MKKICVVTGTRSEYGLFRPILYEIEKSQNLSLQLVATTMHMAAEFGNTYALIEQDGFRIDEKVENLIAADTASSMAKSTGLATVFLSDVFTRLAPDVVLLLGDRFETLGAATAAMLMNIPIAHIHGGEVTEGAVDDQIRHAVSKMASLHFTSTQKHRDRVIQMGEAPERVFCSGAPGIDNILSLELMDRDTLQKDLGWTFSAPTALFTYHAETLSSYDEVDVIKTVLSELDEMELNILFTYANADHGGRVINKSIEAFAKRDPKRYKVVPSLGQTRYLSVLKYADLVIGNSSSGIIEAASFHKPVVNIGERQRGRQQSGNVIDCMPKTLKSAVDRACSKEFIAYCKQVENVYGAGQASRIIVETLENQTVTQKKGFIDMERVKVR